VARAPLSGVNRAGAIAFTINDVAYVSLGYSNVDNSGNLTLANDTWAYYPGTDSIASTGAWVRRAPFPGPGRCFATAFSIGGKGYVGTGSPVQDQTIFYKDFWEYDPQANKWTQKADFPGTARYLAVGFGIGNFGYIGTGLDSVGDKNDFYRYDPATDSWSTIVGDTNHLYGGNPRHGSCVFVINNQAYLCCGEYSTAMQTDLWVYDQSIGVSGAWSQKRQIANASSQSYDDSYNIVRSYASAFAMNTKYGNKGYVCLGRNTALLSDVWEYDPTEDLWTSKTAFGLQENGAYSKAALRTGAVAFSIHDRGYIATGTTGANGVNGSGITGALLIDCWEFRPYDTYESLAP
jgi:N-acetylneuraminic acid mutarotase